MKFFWSIIFIFISSIGFAQSNKNGVATINTNIYCSHCAQCETCGELFAKNILKIKGVKMYTINDKENSITVHFNPKKTDLAHIKNGIAALGYNADDVKADPNAYEKLDDCCKKK